MGIQACENCERTIGHLEERYTYRGATICHECYGRLSTTNRAASVCQGTLGEPVVRRPKASPPVIEPVVDGSDVVDPGAPAYDPADASTYDLAADVQPSGYSCAGCGLTVNAADLTETSSGCSILHNKLWLKPTSQLGPTRSTWFSRCRQSSSRHREKTDPRARPRPVGRGRYSWP